MGRPQGSQWDSVQVFAPDLYAASRAGRMEAGQQLWKRLAYVAITRAVTRLIWVKRYALAMPRVPLDTSDLRVEPVALTLERQSDDA